MVHIRLHMHPRLYLSILDHEGDEGRASRPGQTSLLQEQRSQVLTYHMSY